MLLTVISDLYATPLIVCMGGATTLHLSRLHLENDALVVDLSI